ncbi:MAG: NADH-quinone oxidoreductase subunit M [Burkholderiaceae bacterium]
MLAALILIFVVGGVLALAVERWHRDAPRWISLLATLLGLALPLWLWWQHAGAATPQHADPWLMQMSFPWIARFGIRVHLALDGMSLMLVLLTALLGVISVLCSWREIQTRIGFFHLNLCFTLAGAIGVFLALDLFLFFFFWELMLVPMYFLIAIWGHEKRRYASIKFFVFTQGSGLLMLVAILGLVFVHQRASGTLSFDYFDLLHSTMSPTLQMWLMLGFFVAFAVKLPAFLVHSWLPDAHTQAPTAGSVILAGVLLKTGAYGMLRFVVPLFPDAAARFAPVAMALGVAGILYGAMLALAQTDMKRLVAYTSVSHLGFVLLGIFAWNAWALSGALMQMLAHGIATSALFVLVGVLQERMHTRDMREMGGLWATIPRLAAIGLFFAMASLGLPSTGNFIGEFLVLVGSFRVSIAMTVIASLGLVSAMVYALALVQRSFHGENVHGWKLADSTPREMTTFAVLIAVTLWLGLYPQPIFHALQPALDSLRAISALPGGTP